MNRAYIKFNSITHARLAQETLLGYSVKSQISRNRNPGRMGCGYVLYPDSDIYTAFGIIERENIKNSGFEGGGGL